jgi:fructokinase
MVDVVVLGEALIDLIATQRNVTLFDAPAFEPKPGGAPANVAVGVRRLGRSSALIGRVGRDDFGRGMRHLLESEEVTTTNLLDDPDLMTTMALVSLSDTGDPHFAFYMGASTRLQPSDLDQDLIANARLFHFSSVSLAREPARSATLEALRIAKAHGVWCSYDVNWRPAIWSDQAKGLAIIKEPIPKIDILKLSAGELQLLTGSANPRDGLEHLDVPAALVIVTSGKEGCLYRFDGAIAQQSVDPVENVIDATGAGDAFMSAVLAGLHLPLNAAELPRLMRRACKAGAITVTRRGAIAALPYLDDLAEFPL